MRAEIGLKFLERCETEPDTGALIAAYIAAVAGFAFDGCAAGAWVGTGRARTYRFYFNSWPAAWRERYESKGYFLEDPLILEAQRRMQPFLWSEVAQERSFTVHGRRVVEAAAAFGWREFLAVPVHGPAGYHGVVSLATTAHVALSGAERELVRAMSLAIHDRCRLGEHVGLAESGPELTRREVECLQWVAAGKTDRAIAALVGISAATVHFHIERAKRKLGTHSRARAVALLMLRGLA